MAHTKELLSRMFGRLTVLRRHGSDTNGRALWLCSCVCGRRKIAQGRLLLRGTTTSCGCFATEVKSRLRLRDLTGRHFGFWSVLRRASAAPRGRVRWHCRCLCGAERDVIGNNLVRGLSQSCGDCARAGRTALKRRALPAEPLAAAPWEATEEEKAGAEKVAAAIKTAA